MQVVIDTLGLRFSLVGDQAQVANLSGTKYLQMPVTDALARPTEVLTPEAIDKMPPSERMQRLLSFVQLPCCQALLS
jgi:hypothetical protein